MRIEVNGTRLWFDVEGTSLVPDGPAMHERPTVIAIHGGPGSYDHTYLRPHFAPLAELAQVVYLDLRDHGRSDRGDPAAWSFEACADDVTAFCDALGLDRPILLGHSMGGFVAMLNGARHPGRAAGLVLVSTTARHDAERLVEGFRRAGGDAVAETARRAFAGEPVTAEEWAPAYAAYGRHVPDPEARARITRSPAVGESGMDRLRALDVVDQLGRITCPTLVVVGELDPVTPIAASEEIVGALAPGIGRLEVIPDAGHFTWLDAPDPFWATIAPFVTAHVADPVR